MSGGSILAFCLFIEKKSSSQGIEPKREGFAVERGNFVLNRDGPRRTRGDCSALSGMTSLRKKKKN